MKPMRIVNEKESDAQEWRGVGAGCARAFEAIV
jgi:hypothetical protein